jgi:hypothetical protein
MGLRLGGTKWKEYDQGTFWAFESDFHFDYKILAEKFSLSLQPVLPALQFFK